MLGACAVRARGASLGCPRVFICTRFASCGLGTAAVAACPSSVVCSGVATGKLRTPRCQRAFLCLSSPTMGCVWRVAWPWQWVTCPWLWSGQGHREPSAAWKGTCLQVGSAPGAQGADLGTPGLCRVLPSAAPLMFASLPSLVVQCTRCAACSLAQGWPALSEIRGSLSLPSPPFFLFLAQPSSLVPRTQLLLVPGEQPCPCSSGSRLPPTRRREEMDAAVRSRAPANYPSECVL